MLNAHKIFEAADTSNVFEFSDDDDDDANGQNNEKKKLFLFDGKLLKLNAAVLMSLQTLTVNSYFTYDNDVQRPHRKHTTANEDTETGKERINPVR